MEPEDAAAEMGSFAGEKQFGGSGTVAAVLDWLLGHDPPLHTIAIGENGLAVPMPLTVPIESKNVLDGVGSILELCVAADLPEVVKAWERTRQTGGAQVAVHLRNDPEVTVLVHFVDARQRYGVFLGFLVGDTRPVAGSAVEPPILMPRLFVLERNELGIILDIDDAGTKILGRTKAELVGRRTLDLIHPDDRPFAIAHWMGMLARPTFHPRQVFRYQRGDGTYVWLEGVHDNRLADPASRRVVTQMVDVSDRMDAIEALRASDQLLRRLTEALPIGIVQIDSGRLIVHANKRLGTLVGVARAATIDEQFTLVAVADRAMLAAAVDAVLGHGIAADIEVTFDIPDLHRRCSVGLRALANDDGTVTGAIACVADITDGVRMRAELERRAKFDELTNCENRSAILEKLESVLHPANPPCPGIAVFFIDLNRFKATNDRFGHAAGDELLRSVAERLLRGARTGDVVGRLGGDEFLVICQNVPTPQSALEIARRTAASVAQVTVIATQPMVPTASIGVAWTDMPIDTDTLVARADAAMYESKHTKAGPVLFHTATIEPIEPAAKLLPS